MKVQIGLQNVHYAEITSRSETGYTFGTVKPLVGAVSLTLDVSGDSTNFHADNVKYATFLSNQGYSGTLELAMLPEDFETSILGVTLDSKGVEIENADAQPKHYALGCQIDGDEYGRRIWFYDCFSNRPNVSAQTKAETVEVQTQSLPIEAMPRLDNHDVLAKKTKTSDTDTVYDGFFANVYAKQ